MQAAVTAPSAATAEAWSTALTVLGAEGLRLVEAEPGLEAWLQEEGGETHITSSWQATVSFEPIP